MNLRIISYAFNTLKMINIGKKTYQIVKTYSLRKKEFVGT